MILLRKPKTLTWCAVLLLTGVALWGWTVDPARPGRWLFIALFGPALWGYVEFAQGGERRRERAVIMDWHRIVFAWAGLVLSLRVGVELAVATDVLDPAWGPIAQRARWIITGASLAVWGELSAKAAVAVAARRRTVRLVAGASVRRLAVHGGRRCGGWGVVGGATARPGEVPVTSEPWHRGRAGGRAEADVVGLAT